MAGPSGERILAAENFFTGPRQTVLRHGEIMVEVLIPIQPAGSGASYRRFSRRKGAGLAVTSVAARLVIAGGTIADARVALGAVAPVPLPAADCCLALVGQKPEAGVFEAAAEKAAAESQPITDIRGTEEFRRELVRVLTLRALEESCMRAGGTDGT
jgi:carbon-monoxide dehydrogenase medium subunit